MELTRGHICLRFIQPDGEGKEAYESYFGRCQQMEAELKWRLKEYDPTAHIEYKHEDKCDIYDIEMEEGKIERQELCELLTSVLQRHDLHDYKLRLAAH